MQKVKQPRSWFELETLGSIILHTKFEQSFSKDP
jgi:hypothetical protein